MKQPDYILIADVESATHHMLHSVLGLEGYRVVATNKGTEAFTTAIKETPALVLVNDLLPGIDGYSLCRRLRDHPSTHLVPIIMLTNDDLVTGRVAALEAGADDYIAKPFRSGELQDHISRLIDKPVAAAHPSSPLRMPAKRRPKKD